VNDTDPSAKAAVQSLEPDTRWHTDSTEELYDEPSKASTKMLSAVISAGNQLRVLQDGKETLPAMFHAIRTARHYVHLEYYVIEDVHVGGESLFELLMAKCKSGVQIAIIFDAVGSSNTPSEFFAGLHRHGVRLLPFNPVNPRKLRSPYSLNHRDHRKILIADGMVAIVGGINMTRAYEGPPDHPLSAASATVRRSQRRWRDTDLEVKGPAVAHLERLFLEHWSSHGGTALKESGSHAPLAQPGRERVAIIGSRPQSGGARFYEVLLAALRAAQHRVWITAGYFLPTVALMRELAQAASRQVDVKLLLPSHNDSIAALAVQRSTYARLLDAGVEILERNSVILHSKSAVIDQSWSCVGTSNIDARSVRYNHEVDAIVVGTKTAKSLAQLFLEDLSKARRIEPAAWHSRPVTEKLREMFWRPWQGLL
jgi:cardiolipin synthase A/B